MQNYLYAQLRADRGLVNLDGCAYGDAGCRRQFVPTATDATMDPETEKQELLRAHLFARALPTGRGYAALHDGVHETHLGRVCVGAGAEGTHYLTVYADPVLSGDGRLSASSDGYMSTAGDSPVEGVESFGIEFQGWFDYSYQSNYAGFDFCTWNTDPHEFYYTIGEDPPAKPDPSAE